MDFDPRVIHTDRVTTELDHFFVFTGEGAPQADLLAEAGLVEGPGNEHPGQGTANRRFFFPNTGLELIFLNDEDEARNGPGAGLRLAERATTPNASPYGLIVKGPEAPFPGWRYCPEYFDDDQCFHVGANSDALEEPLCVWLPPNLPIADSARREDNPGFVLSGLQVDVPVDSLSETLQAVDACDNVSIRSGRPHGMRLEFNEGSAGMCCDLAPFPLKLRW